MTTIPEDFFFFEIKGKGILYGRGPFTESSTPSTKLPTLYAPDFFLRNKNPYLIPTEARWIQGLPFDEGFSEVNEIFWEEPSFHDYQQHFAKVTSALHSEEIVKAVPIIFQHGVVERLSIAALCRPLFSLPTTLHGYCLKRGAHMMVGSSPEILFTMNSKEGSIFSEAVAGSVPKADGARLLVESSLLKEHDLVIHDIASELSSFGKVSISETHVQELPLISHLRARIEVALRKVPSLEDVITALHPTGAVGIVPRKPLTSRFVQEILGPLDRGRFGAPFGLVIPGELTHIIVGIRSIILDGKTAKIGVGSGVIKGRSAEVEWEELSLKRNSIRNLFSI